MADKRPDPDVIKISELHGEESLRLAALFREQAQKPNGYSIDRIAYTDTMQRIADAMAREFPRRGWNVRRAYLSLMSFRKAGLMERTQRPNRKKADAAEVAAEPGQ